MTAVRTLISRRPVISFVVLAYAISWSIWITLSLVLADPSLLVVLPGGFGPAIAAAIVVGSTGESLRAWVRDMARWRINPRWYLAALGLPLLFTGFQSLTYVMFVGSPDLSVVPRRLGFWLVSFLVALLLTGGNEELGWRGFMQPRLQRSYSAVTAAVVVGVVWTIWHLPLHVFLPSLSNGFTTLGVISRLATVPIAIIFAWLYNATDGSVIVAMLFHAGWNTSETLLPVHFGSPDPSTVLLVRSARVATMLVVVILLLIAHNTESLSSAGRHTQRIVSESVGKHVNQS